MYFRSNIYRNNQWIEGGGSMGNFTSGFQELANKLIKAQQKVPVAIDNALIDTGYSVVGHAKDNSPIDTSTLEQSWEIEDDNLQLGDTALDDTHSLSVWSSPTIIATNPKHPNGEYYSPMIENGFDLPNGKHYPAQNMLKNAMTPAKDDLKNNLTSQLGDVFNED
jgi:hypothetical protein